MKYRSRISILLAAAILGIFTLPLSDILASDTLEYAKIVAIGIPFIFTVSIFASINYTISDKKLLVSCLGFKMATIDISQIKTIKRTYNPLSSPAASLKRLEVKYYRNGRIETCLISPIREKEFAQKLNDVNPNLHIKIAAKESTLRPWNWDI